MKLKLLAIALVLALSGCSAKVYQRPQAEGPEKATIVAMKKRGIVGVAARNRVLFDGFKVAEIGTGDRFRFTTDAGTHSVGIRNSSLSLHFEADETYYFAIKMRPSLWVPTFERVDRAEAARLKSKTEPI